MNPLTMWSLSASASSLHPDPDREGVDKIEKYFMEFQSSEFAYLIQKLVDQPITKVEFDKFSSTSSQTVSSIIDLIRHFLDEKFFVELSFTFLIEYHCIEAWTLS